MADEGTDKEMADAETYMDEKLLLETVVLAGEVMLKSNAEVYRVEDTMRHMLSHCGYDPTEMIVISTGIFATINNHEDIPITVIKRIPSRSTNIDRIYQANVVSRDFYDDKITLEDAYSRLNEISESEKQFKPFMRAVGTTLNCAFFSPMFGGVFQELVGAAIVGTILAIVNQILSKIELNDFCVNAICAAVASFSAFSLEHWFWPGLNVDVIVISAILPLIPGVIFTTAVRDTLNGDYLAGCARMLEAIIIALAVAAGVATGMVCFHLLAGGI